MVEDGIKLTIKLHLLSRDINFLRSRYNPAFMLLYDIKCIFILDKRYSPLLGLTFSSCGGLRALAEAFFALLAKKRAFWMFLLILASVTFSSNLSNLSKHKKSKKYLKKISEKI